MPTDKQKAAAKAKLAPPEPPPAAEPPKQRRPRLKQTGVISSKDDKVVNVGGTAADGTGMVLKEWMRMPKTLLQEHCQSNKVPKPEYYATQRGGEHFCRVRMPDPKNKDKDVHVNCPVGAHTNQDAQHKAALYTLLQITPNVQHHRKLPDVYRDLWLQWQAQPPAQPHGKGGGKGGGRGGGGEGGSGGRGGGGDGRGGGGGGNGQLSLVHTQMRS